MFSLLPGESNPTDGLKFQIYVPRMIQYLGIDEEVIKSWLPENKREWKYYETAPPDMSGYEGFFNSMQEINRFLEGIKNIKSKAHFQMK